MGLVLFKHFITGIVVPSRSWHTDWIWPQVGQNYSMAGKTLEGMLARADQNRRMAPCHQSHMLLSTTGVIKLMFFSSRSIWNPRDFCCGVISPNDILMPVVDLGQFREPIWNGLDIAPSSSWAQWLRIGGGPDPMVFDSVLVDWIIEWGCQHLWLLLSPKNHPAPWPRSTAPSQRWVSLLREPQQPAKMNIKVS